MMSLDGMIPYLFLFFQDFSADVFLTLKKHPNLILDKFDKWGFYPDTELHATNQKYLMDLETQDCPEGFWPVFKGSSFNIWNSETGEVYAWANPGPVFEFLQKKRLKGWSSGRGGHREFSQSHIENENTIASKHPRISFRDITNRTNRRTTIAALIPPNVFVTHKAPYFLRAHGDEKDEAYLLGLLCSIPLTGMLVDLLRLISLILF